MTDPRPRIRRSIQARPLVALLVTLAMLVALPAAEAAPKSGSESIGFGAAPMRFDLDVAPGKTVTRELTITNTGPTADTFSFSKEDFQGDKDEPAATPVLLGGKFKSDISGYDWMELPGPVTIAGGDSKTVSVKVSAPADAKGGHYVALIVSSEAQEVGNLLAQSRIAVLFMLNAGGVPPPDIVITEIKKVGPTTTVTEYVNNGETATKPRIRVTQDPLGPGPSRTVTGPCTEALPGGAGSCTVDLSRDGGGADGEGTLAAGPYKTYVGLIGDDEGTAARGEMPTEWAGTWSSLLLPLAGLALFALYFLFLRRRRKDEEEDENAGGGDAGWAAPQPLS